MHTIHIKYCGAVFVSEHDSLESAMETYRVLRRRNVRDVIVRDGKTMICGIGECAAQWQLPNVPGNQLAIAAH